ncbi:50S ribosomal protein L10 [Helicobacter cetorum]|uniref:50S ribosomal protein L10 n=1 Tax=Helicobacter cetorum TaxID=138563 RepID=UPI000CF0A9D2|nr:50S ribosomal protein L10 [Helicobacter cetorum]
MQKQHKIELVASLKAEFSNAQALLVCDYKGLSVSKLEVLRNKARVQGIKVQVIKNTLAHIAMKEAGCAHLDLKETNVFLWGDDQIALAKLVFAFQKEYKDHFALKAGLFDKESVSVSHVEAVSKLPSKEELMGMLLSVWTAPTRYFVTGLDNLRKAKEENQ